MIKIFSDGGSRGNPGKAASAFAVFENEEVVSTGSKYLGIKTNNYAEYYSVILALNWVIENQNSLSGKITYYLDSELVTKQITGVYKVKSPQLIPLAMEVAKLRKQISLEINFLHVTRDKNTVADKLVNQELDLH